MLNLFIQNEFHLPFILRDSEEESRFLFLDSVLKIKSQYQVELVPSLKI